MARGGRKESNLRADYARIGKPIPQPERVESDRRRELADREAEQEIEDFLAYRHEHEDQDPKVDDSR